MRRKRAGVIAVMAACLLAASAALPWAGSGETTRNAYSLARATRDAGLLTGVSGSLAVLVFLLPLLAAIAVTLTAWGAGRVGGLASLACGLVGVSAVVAVLQSSLEAKPGTTICAVIAMVAVVSGSIAAAGRPHT